MNTVVTVADGANMYENGRFENVVSGGTVACL